MVFVLRMDRLGCGGGVAGVGDCAAAGARRDPDPDDKVASFTKCPQRFLRRIFPLSAKLSRRLKKAQPVTVVLSLLNLVTIVALATVCVMFLWTDKKVKPRTVVVDVNRMVDCRRVVGPGQDPDYVRLLAANRISFDDTVALGLLHPERPLPPSASNEGGHRLLLEKAEELAQCEAIRRAYHFAAKARSPTEADFPLAYARVIFRDYFLVEAEFAVHFQPQNQYCFAVDRDSPASFRDRVRLLARCFPDNVVLADREWPLDSAGHNMNRAHMDCLRQLSTPGHDHWRYVFLLQNHEVQLKTNAEAVQILRWMNGTNDVEVGPIQTPHNIDLTLNWTLDALKLLKPADSPATRLTTPTKKKEFSHHEHERLTLAKGMNAVALTRPAVQFVLDQLDLDRVLAQIDDPTRYAVDEFLFPSLQATADLLGMPGGFTGDGVRQKINAPLITRYAIFAYTLQERLERCPGPGEKLRHKVCLFGVDDLQFLDERVQLFANKFWPEFDAGAVHCWHEHMRQRTAAGDDPTVRLKQEVYTDLPAVRWNNAGRRKLSPAARTKNNTDFASASDLLPNNGKEKKESRNPLLFDFNYAYWRDIDVFGCRTGACDKCIPFDNTTASATCNGNEQS